jgi:hypothetical protein
VVRQTCAEVHRKLSRSRGTQPPGWDKERKSRRLGQFPDGHIGIMVETGEEEKCQRS